MMRRFSCGATFILLPALRRWICNGGAITLEMLSRNMQLAASSQVLLSSEIPEEGDERRAQAQRAMANIPEESWKKYCEFNGIKVEADKSCSAAALQHYAKHIEEMEEGEAVESARQVSTVDAAMELAKPKSHKLLPVYLISFYREEDGKKQRTGQQQFRVEIYEPIHRKIRTQNFGKQSVDIFEFLQGLTDIGKQAQGVFLLTNEQDLDLAKEFRSICEASGFQCHTHIAVRELVDTLVTYTMGENFKGKPLENVYAALKKKNPQLAEHASGEEKFSAAWELLCAASARSGLAGTPTRIINDMVHPPGDVVLVSLIRSGSRLLNVSLFDPVSGRTKFSSGGMEEILSLLLDIKSPSLIMVPTPRSDRPYLLSCRAALHRCGKSVTFVYPSTLDPAFRSIRSFSAQPMWREMCKKTRTNTVDLLWDIKKQAGTVFRYFLETREPLVVLMNKKQAIENKNPIVGKSVARWLETIQNPQRKSSEECTKKSLEKFCCISLVTTALIAYRRSANPTVPENYVIAAGFSDYKGHYFRSLKKLESRAQFQLPCLDEYDIIVLHNAKNNAHYLWEDPQFRAFLHRGGKVWCTGLAEYLLSAQRTRMPQTTLSTIGAHYSPRMLAEIEDDKEITGVDVTQLPLLRHRATVSKELKSLESAFLGQTSRAVEQYQLKSILMRMDAMLAMTDMEHNGIAIDKEEALKQAHQVRNEVIATRRALNMFVPRDIPLDVRRYFSWSSVNHLNALFYGGDVALGPTPSEALPVSLLVELIFSTNQTVSFGNHELLKMYMQQQNITPVPTSTTIDLISRQLQNKKPRKFRLVCFDLETTGLNVEDDKIIEMAFFDPEKGSVFSTLINPEQPISPESTDIHHITDTMVRTAPTLRQVIPKLAEFLRIGEFEEQNETIILIAHNSISLDEPMFRRALLHHYDAFFDFKEKILFCDTIPLFNLLRDILFRSGKDKLKSLKLNELAQVFNLKIGGTYHRAVNDAKILWDCLTKAFSCFGYSFDQQKTALLHNMVKTILASPARHCFADARSDEKPCDVKVHLPGLFRQFFPDDPKGALRNQFKSRVFDTGVLNAFCEKQCHIANLLKVKKRLDTENLNFLELNSDETLAVLHPDNKVRQDIALTSTTTGRTTSSNPSCQNIPKDSGKQIRHIFKSRFGDDGLCVEVDYATLEIGIMAVLCQDKNMIKDLGSGIDYHSRRASSIDPRFTYEQIVEGYRAGDPEMVKLRRKAKIISFQRLYGAGPTLLAKTTKLPLSVINDVIAHEERTFPGIKKFQDLVRSVAMRPGNPGLPTHYIFELPTGCRVSFAARDVAFGLPPVKNYPIQSYGAEVVQLMLGKLFRHFYECDNYSKQAFIVNFVHDSVWLDCHRSVAWKAVTDTCRILSDSHRVIPKEFPGASMPLQLKVVASAGKDMHTLTSLEKLLKGEPQPQEPISDDDFDPGDLLMEAEQIEAEERASLPEDVGGAQILPEDD